MKHNFDTKALNHLDTTVSLDESKNHTYHVEIFSDEIRGVVPAPLAEDFGYAFVELDEAWGWLVQLREQHSKGKLWSIKEDQRHEAFLSIWRLLSNINVTGDVIEEPFLHYPKGSNIFDIWYWLERDFNIKIADYV